MIKYVIFSKEELEDMYAGMAVMPDDHVAYVSEERWNAHLTNSYPVSYGDLSESYADSLESSITYFENYLQMTSVHEKGRQFYETALRAMKEKLNIRP